VNVTPSELNQHLAELLRNSVMANQFRIAGKVGFWRLLGIGFVAFGIGASVGIGFWGYSYLTRNSDNSTVLLSSFSRALSNVQLRATAEGVVYLEPRELLLAKDQTVSFDRNSRVRLDPSAKLQADGELKIQTPSISIPQATQRTATRVPTITNFTVFKSVSFGSGLVQTGWIFLTSTQRLPTHQYCYYTENSETPGLDIRLDLGSDQRIETPSVIPQDFDVQAAFSRCVWFKSNNT
jgi:hypothetical protein